MGEAGIHAYNRDGPFEQHSQAIERLKGRDLGAPQILRNALASLPLFIASPGQNTSEAPSGECPTQVYPCSLGPELVAAAAAVQQHRVRLRRLRKRSRDGDTIIDRLFHPITQRSSTQGPVARHRVLRKWNMMRDIVESRRKRLARSADVKSMMRSEEHTSELQSQSNL